MSDASPKSSTKPLTAVAGLLVGILLVTGGYLLGQTSRHHGDAAAPDSATRDAPASWTCSMHPAVALPAPGTCPICGMNLVALSSETTDTEPRRLVMSEAARKLADIATTAVERRFVAKKIRLTGKVDYDETRLRTVSAWVAGRLERLYVDYTGIEVRRGDHLVRLYSPALLEAQEELIQASRQVANGTAETSPFLRESSQRSLASAREKLRLWGLDDAQIAAIEKRDSASDQVEINAPIGGVVIEKLRKQGDYVQEGSGIYVLADLSRLWVKLDAYEKDLPWIRYGQDVEIEAEALPGKTLQGTIAFIDPMVNPRTRTVGVRVNVDNTAGLLKPGMFVRSLVRSQIASEGRVMDPALAGKWISPMHPEVVKDGPGDCDVCGMDLVRAEDLGFATGEDSKAKPLVVPATAVLRTGKRAVVYVKDPDAQRPTYRGRDVVLGPRAGDFYLVRSGLREGEEVVVHGAFKIDSELQIRGEVSMMSQPAESPEHAALRTSLVPMWEAYLAAGQALADDDAVAAREAMATLAAAVTQGTDADDHGHWKEAAAALSQAAGQAAVATNIADLRTAFQAASVAALALERDVGHAGSQDHVEVFCPMAFDEGASWLQLGDQVQNPYYGASMLRCGVVKKRHLGVGEER